MRLAPGMNIEALIAEHKDAVYRQMVRVCGSHEDAEDALSDAILAAIRAAETIKDEGAFRAWLVKVGSRACIRSRVRSKLKLQVSLAALEELGFDIPDSEPGPETQVLESEVSHCVSKALQSLPEGYREVYLRREIQQEPGEETAEALGLTLAAMKSRLHRARAMVRESLDTEVSCLEALRLSG